MLFLIILFSSICCRQVNSVLVQDVFDYETGTSTAVPMPPEDLQNYGFLQDLEYSETGAPVKFGSIDTPSVSEENENSELECVRMSPFEMFITVVDIIQVASRGMAFIVDASKTNSSWGELVGRYLEDANFDGIIILARDQAVDIYARYVEQNYNVSRAEISSFQFVPSSLNVGVIGPIENTAQGGSVSLYRDYYIETEEREQAFIDEIIQFPSSCQQVEFWITDRVLVPPPREAPSFTEPKLDEQIPQQQFEEIMENELTRTFPLPQQRSFPLPQDSNIMGVDVDIIVDLDEVNQSPMEEEQTIP
eukprot:TRINITY_DN4622_c0_g1_i1.p1 TRINITY_DN4622_c0_g1~~TRINITY_DN4622_c0_g1_i1.p1  ORF type:complete len:306 (-),score=45.62 TRINITY_DN4622_c0_g1_i1:900-1817(-)